MRQQLVQLHLAQHAAQRGQCKLLRLVLVVGHLHHGQPRVDDAQEDHRVHLQRNVVPRDHILRRHVEGDLPQIHPHHAVQRRKHQNDARALGLGQQAAQPEDDAALILAESILMELNR